MNKYELKRRTKTFAINIVRFVDTIPHTTTGHAVANQIVRSGTSVGANYRAACRAKSDRDFLNKIVIIEEEADETGFWLKLLTEAGLLHNNETDRLLREADELTAIFTATGKSMRERMR